jgi:acetyl-CoA carboxylase carboxyl transferase subunit alpha
MVRRVLQMFHKSRIAVKLLQAAEALKLTATHMKEMGLIDGIVQEPQGAAHIDPEGMAKILKAHIKSQLPELMKLSPDRRIKLRIEKYRKMGNFENSKS